MLLGPQSSLARKTPQVTEGKLCRAAPGHAKGCAPSWRGALMVSLVSAGAHCWPGKSMLTINLHLLMGERLAQSLRGGTRAHRKPPWGRGSQLAALGLPLPSAVCRGTLVLKATLAFGVGLGFTATSATLARSSMVCLVARVLLSCGPYKSV